MKVAAVLVAVLAAAALAGEATGLRTPVYAGTAAGALIGLVGFGFAVAIARRNRAERETGRKQPGKWDIWTLWGSGVLVRMVLLGVCAGVLMACLPDDWRTALLALASVYLPLMAVETWWLMSRIVDSK
ncbi:MAG: hypothetical protein KIS92_06035 [Planctomycetota bacterium]|nr:hypothetical protein [Planctomycetota bacterium]